MDVRKLTVVFSYSKKIYHPIEYSVFVYYGIDIVEDKCGQMVFIFTLHNLTTLRDTTLPLSTCN